MRRHLARRSVLAAPPGASPPAPSSAPRRGVVPLHPDDRTWLHDLLRWRGETRRWKHTGARRGSTFFFTRLPERRALRPALGSPGHAIVRSASVRSAVGSTAGGYH